MKKIIFSLTVVSGLLLSCSQSENQSGQPLVVCTTGFVGDAVEHLLAEHAKVVTLMGAGVDPHTYKPSQGDMQNLMQADIVVYNGLHLEGNMANVLEKISNSKKIIAMADGVSAANLLPVGENLYDPHIWFDALLWKSAVAHTSRKLAEFLPDLKPIIEKNYLAYSDTLLLLHAEILADISFIAKPSRVLITSHDAFRYFGRSYGMEVKGLQGISTLSEPTLGQITELVNLIFERKIKSIFVESSVSRQAVLSVIEGCKSKGHKLELGGELYSDALGKKNTPEGTYSGVMRHNVKVIRAAL